ncbi:serpin B10 [Papilio machaon]|uniref:serpin B10 n=1 Tax=Papilio machaon TaxID=76193 RepID=UPI001E664F55|nr:serpin B10 [Papilio machaon]
MAKFIRSLDSLERKFYKVTFEKLTSSSPVERKENGISFVQTGVFLHLALMALSTEVDVETRREIEECIALELTDREKMYILREIISSLPKTSDALKFRLSSRLVVGRSQALRPQFQHGVAPAMRLRIDRVNTTNTAQALTDTLNKMVEKDSKGAMRDTFEEEELSEGMRAVLLSTMYVRARWRSAPTVLNGTHSFLDSDSAPQRTMRMIRINDIMRYTELNEWDAEAIEIFYATPGLSLLLLVPRGRSLRQLAGHVADTSIYHVLDRMYTLRVAVTLPLYTLRMTLLLPNKLQAMGISRLVDDSDAECSELRLSHAVQRLMFWAEAGRNAFKDDGIEWDEAPELELVVNRPYVFFVRWRNITIMNGHFVL